MNALYVNITGMYLPIISAFGSQVVDLRFSDVSLHLSISPGHASFSLKALKCKHINTIFLLFCDETLGK